MTNWLKNSNSDKLIAFLIAGAFVVVTFACFAMMVGDSHQSEMDTVCETVMNLADNTIVQTGFALLLLMAVAWISIGRGVFSEVSLQLISLYSPPLYKQVRPREYSYLSQLFSSGLIHSKLHTIYA